MNNTLTIGVSGGSYIRAVNVVSQEGRKTVRRYAGAGIGLEVDLTISHQETGGAIKYRRSLQRIDVYGVATDGRPIRQSIQLVVETAQVAGGDLLTVTNIRDLLKGIADNGATAGADLTAYLAGEI
jgi:hypothetical protein